MHVKGKTQNLMFVVVPDAHKSLLEDRAWEDLELLKRVYQLNREKVSDTNTGNYFVNYIVHRFPEMFKGQGMLPFTYKIQLKCDAKPVIHAPQRVPGPLRDSLKKELDRMMDLGVIRPIKEPTDWVKRREKTQWWVKSETPKTSMRTLKKSITRYQKGKRSQVKWHGWDILAN